jgi:phosphoesterase RecJ-like protein
VLERIAEQLKRAGSVGIFTHTRPDGDAYGSALALSLALNALSIPNYICVDGDAPSNLQFLELGGKTVQKPPFEAEAFVAVDASEGARLGDTANYFFTAKNKRKPTYNIDHHISNTRFADFNFVKPCAANCLHIARLIAYMGVPFTKEMAEYLLVGVLTDSGNFSHDDVDEECFLTVAELIKAGANLHLISYELFKKQPKQRLSLLSSVTAKTRYYFDNRFAAIVISKAELEKANADLGMTEGLVDFALSVDTVEVAAALLEMKPNQYKISLRSKFYADANKIASVYGGGGHIRAAGCMLFGDLEDVLDRLSYTVSQYLD